MTVSEFVNKVGFKVKEDDVKKVNSTISDIKSTATKVLGAIGIGFSLVSMKNLIEEFGQVNNQINYAVGGMEASAAAQKKILEAANNCRGTYSEIAAYASNLAQANSGLFPIEDAAKFVEYTTKLGKAAGYTDSVISSTHNTLNKVFASGKMGAGELQNLSENAPAVINTICNRLGVTKEQLQSMAAAGTLSAQTIKEAMLNSAGEIDDAFSNVDLTISDALKHIRNRWGQWLAETDQMLGLTKTIAKTMVSGFNTVMSVLNKLRTGVVWLSEKLGGTENLLKLIGIAGGSILVVMKAEKIITFLKTAKTLLGAISLKTMAIIAVIMLIALIIDDFVNFMQGNNSLLGEFFKKMGIDADEARNAIKKAFTKVKDFLIQVCGVIKNVLLTVWKIIKAAAIEIFTHLQQFWEKNGERIKTLFVNVWNLIWDVLKGIWTLMSTVAQAIFGALKDFWEKNGESIKETFFFVWDAISETIISIWEIIYGIAREIFDKIKAYFTENGESIKQKYSAIWEKISGYLSAVWNVISQVAHIVFGGIRDFFAENGGLIKDTFVAIWDAIVAILKPVWDFICNLAMKVFGALQTFWEKWGGTIIDLFQSVWNIISGIFKAVFEVLKGIFNVFAGLFTGDWQKLWDGIKSIFVGIWDSIVAIFSNIWNVIKDVVSIALGIIQTAITIVWEAVKGVFSTVWGWISNFFKAIWGGICAAVSAAVNAISNAMSNIFTGIKNTVSNIKNAIVNGFQAAIDWIKGLPSQALQWGKDIISNIANGIKSAVSKVTDAVSGVANKIKSFLGFSEPEDGPLSDFHTYMPDMIALMSKGIQDGRNKIKDALGDLTGDMSVMASANLVSGSTASTAAGGSNVSKNIVQNVNINNEFNGDKAIQRDASKAMNRSAEDVTSQLARGLAYSG